MIAAWVLCHGKGADGLYHNVSGNKYATGIVWSSMSQCYPSSSIVTRFEGTGPLTCPTCIAWRLVQEAYPPWT